MGMSVFPCVVTLGVIVHEVLFVCHHPVEPMDTSLPHHQSQAVKGCLFWGAATKAGALNMYTSSFLTDIGDLG